MANTIVSASSAAPYLNAYPWSSSGFGARYAAPAGLTTSRGSVACTHQDVFAGSPSGGSNQLVAYPWSSSGFGTAYSPASTNNYTRGVAVSKTGTEVGHCSNPSSVVDMFPWVSGTGFGTRFSDAAESIQGYAIDFNTSFVAFRMLNSPFISVYPWSASGFGDRKSVV